MTAIAILGAFERDNFGDILFGKIAARILSGVPTVRASLLSADMGDIGGDACVCIDDLVAYPETRPAGVLGFGGETLAASLGQAIAFDLPEPEARVIQSLDAEARRRWLALPYDARPLAYLISPADFGLEPGTFSTAFHSVGGFGLTHPELDPLIAAAARERLLQADLISVRDGFTQAAVKHWTGRDTACAPDAAFVTPGFFPHEIAKAKASLLERRPELAAPFLAFQCNQAILTHFGVAETAAALARLCDHEGLGLVIQPAGLAFGHDDLSQLQAVADQVAALSAPAGVWLQPDRNVWHQCALVGMARAWAGTSLHGRVLATAQGTPAVSLLNAKVEVNVLAWSEPKETAAVDLSLLEGALAFQLARSPEDHRDVARRLAEEAEESFAPLADWARWVMASSPEKNIDPERRALRAEIRRLRSALLREVA